MKQFLKPTPELIAELRRDPYPDLEDDIKCLELPDGDKNACRLQRDETRRGRKLWKDTNGLHISAPWLMSDVF